MKRKRLSRQARRLSARVGQRVGRKEEAILFMFDREWAKKEAGAGPCEGPVIVHVETLMVEGHCGCDGDGYHGFDELEEEGGVWLCSGPPPGVVPMGSCRWCSSSLSRPEARSVD